MMLELWSVLVLWYKFLKEVRSLNRGDEGLQGILDWLPMILECTPGCVRPVFAQRLFVQGIFVQSISSNPTRLGLDEKTLDENPGTEDQSGERTNYDIILLRMCFLRCYNSFCLVQNR